MSDTGSPWNLPYPLPTDLVRDGAQAIEDLAEATATGLSAAGATQREVITASNASYPVPAAARKAGVRIVAIGGGGAGGSADGTGFSGNGGNTVVTGYVTANGGEGGLNTTHRDQAGRAARAGWTAGNQGTGGIANRFNRSLTGASGTGGEIRLVYADLTAVSTLNITVGAGGTSTAGAVDVRGGSGGRGEVILEF